MSSSRSDVSFRALIHPLSTEKFLERCWPNRHGLSRLTPGARKAFLRSLPSQEIHELLLKASKDKTPLMRLRARYSQPWSATEGTLSVSAAQSHFRAGKLLFSFERADSLLPGLVPLLGRLPSHLRTPLAECFWGIQVSPAGMFDDQLNLRTCFLVQLSGRQELRLENSTVSPTQKDKVLLQPGSVLFLPRNYRVISGTQSESLTLILTVEPSRVGDLVWPILKSHLGSLEGWSTPVVGLLGSAGQKSRARSFLNGFREEAIEGLRSLGQEDFLSMLDRSNQLEGSDRSFLMMNPDARLTIHPDSGRHRRPAISFIQRDGKRANLSIEPSHLELFRWLAHRRGPFTISEALRALDRLPHSRFSSAMFTWLQEAGIIRMQPFGEVSPWYDRYIEDFSGFPTRKSDIFIATYPKSGTTLAQFILYQLTTDGKLNFPHLYQVSPYFEKEIQSIGPKRVSDLLSPRILKTHLPYDKVPKGAGRYIYVVRNGMDVALSFYDQYQHLENFSGTFSEFFAHFIEGNLRYGSWFSHVKDWWLNRNQENVLFLSYEDMRNDLPLAVRRIAGFCQIDASPGRIKRTLERCSFQFMKAHEARFGQDTGLSFIQSLKDQRFIRKGGVGWGIQNLSRPEIDAFDKAYANSFERLSSTFRRLVPSRAAKKRS